jgi:predicted O-methyltransferase YrrM
MLQPYYKEYISEVSTPDMAVSFQASIFLYTLTTIKKPRRILDLGSGFSSFIFRLCSMNGLDIIDIYSVDDNQQWLDKTRSYLIAQGTRSDNMLHWQDFQTLNVSKFDLIFHDLGDMDVRSESLPWVLNLLDRGGIIILDDMHKSNYRASTSRLLSKSGFMRYSMRRYTLDEFGRFLELSMLPAI